MAGFIVLQDGRSYAASNWAYDATIESIADAIPESKDGAALKQWLNLQRCRIRGPGLGRVDLRELTPPNQELIVRAIKVAFEKEKEQGGKAWANPDFFPSWIERFLDLIKMLQSIDCGEPPMAFNPHMNGIIEPTGKCEGPGWDEQL